MSDISTANATTEAAPGMRPSNVERARWRDKARHVLSAHIGKICQPTHKMVADQNRAQATGVTVAPSEVRLVVRDDDPYEWDHPPEKYYLFHKSLSKHNLGACRELCREAGHSFRAVKRRESRPHNTVADESKDSETDCHRLLEQNEFLQLQLDEQSQTIVQLQSTLQHRNLEQRQNTRIREHCEARLIGVEQDLQVLRKGIRALEEELNATISRMLPRTSVELEDS